MSYELYFGADSVVFIHITEVAVRSVGGFEYDAYTKVRAVEGEASEDLVGQAQTIYDALVARSQF